MKFDHYAWAAILVVALGDLTAAGWAWSGADSGELAGWIEAVATGAAFISALVAAFYAAGAFHRETARDQQRLDQERSAQASLVSAWVSRVAPLRPRIEHGRLVGPAIGVVQVDVLLRNASQAPVSDVKVEIAIEVEDREGVSLHDFAEQDVWVLPPDRDPIDVFLKPSEPLDLRGAEGDEVPGHRPTLRVSFTDAAGHRWTRLPDGRLEPQRFSTFTSTPNVLSHLLKNPLPRIR